MQLHLSRTHRQQLLDWAAAANPCECCGLLLGRGDIVESIELTANVADDMATHFEIDPATLIHAEKKERNGGLQILGYFHSHPNGKAEPSTEDAAMAAADERRWLIIAKGQVTAWRPVKGPDTIFFEVEGLVET